MNFVSQIDIARADMAKQNPLYWPTAFWEAASAQIVEELRLFGIHRFRSLPSPLGFFVPTYGTPGNSFSAEAVSLLMSSLAEGFPGELKASLSLEQFLSGEFSALADYRVFLGSDEASLKPDLAGFSESSEGEPKEQFEFDSRKFSRSSLNYLLGLAFLKKHLLRSEEIKIVLEVGGGFGTLGEIFFKGGVDGLRYVDIDIPPTSCIAQWYMQRVAGESNVSTYIETRGSEVLDILDLKPLSALCSWQIEKIMGRVDLFVNFISFQEMEPAVVQNYLNHVRRLGARWVLLRNMREGKQARSEKNLVGVETPIRADDYIAMLEGYELVDRNVHPFGFRTVDQYHSELFLFRRI